MIVIISANDMPLSKATDTHDISQSISRTVFNENPSINNADIRTNPKRHSVILAPNRIASEINSKINESVGDLEIF